MKVQSHCPQDGRSWLSKAEPEARSCRFASFTLVMHGRAP
ncbi:MAG: hypothetical protein AVDCRST_MAG26-1270 [uncultured Chloroflexia bacterium]|uniref:Uncharacterized protein n=1 Tax=uncultured Chloroflexia bacterium TaxID=1672391 RepID=A0A6J4I1T3_9CHLR|nr:MAG: hypothetical protein AVDCRST_MAG26-1270 [uncultured Chloroflexia bacterium]